MLGWTDCNPALSLRDFTLCSSATLWDKRTLTFILTTSFWPFLIGKHVMEMVTLQTLKQRLGFGFLEAKSNLKWKTCHLKLWRKPVHSCGSFDWKQQILKCRMLKIRTKAGIEHRADDKWIFLTLRNCSVWQREFTPVCLHTNRSFPLGVSVCTACTEHGAVMQSFH